MKCLLTFLLLNITLAGFGQSSDPLIDSLIAETIKKYGIPAIAAAVVTTDAIHLGIGGVTQVGGTDRVELTDKFHLGSDSKAVTSFVAMKLIEQGKITLATRFFDLVPELKKYARPAYHEMTLGDLLSHNAGIKPFTTGYEFKKLPKLNKGASANRYSFARIVVKRKESAKGTYSNGGYVLASLMLEKASGTTFEDLVATMLAQLGLEMYSGFPNKQNESYPWGHWRSYGKLVAHAPDNKYFLPDYMLSAGNMAMNIVEYSRFIQLHLQGLNGQDNFLKAADYEVLHFGLPKYAYGWGNGEIAPGVRISSHDGSAGTYYCHVILVPANNLAIIIMTNSSAPDQVKGIYALREQLAVVKDKLGK